MIFFQLCLQIHGFACGDLNAVPLANNLNALLESNISLACSATIKPILCLWKTPYGHVYTLSEGVFAESGRLRHEQPHDGVGQVCARKHTFYVIMGSSINLFYLRVVAFKSLVLRPVMQEIGSAKSEQSFEMPLKQILPQSP